MITLVENGVTAKYIGLSTDNKPQEISANIGMKNGSRFLEIDTGDKYYYDADSSQWMKQPSDSDGGSSGAMIVGVTKTTGDHSEEIYTLGKTWQEIHDAIMGGKIAYAYDDYGSEGDQYTMVSGTYVSVGDGGTSYGVTLATNFGNSVFNATTADGYPQYISM